MIPIQTKDGFATVSKTYKECVAEKVAYDKLRDYPEYADATVDMGNNTVSTRATLKFQMDARRCDGGLYGYQEAARKGSHPW